ncbi:NAD(+) synthase [Lachnobacterium bovis]|uniref:Glutamine-dependent NAD(+) synthetase n=1 Tax=Lachnobacterium bovis TaxID=140626 RepID=A0A1H9PE04_9FIRM|nr:NAD(+) synthase [Lachnobacterium bovis]SER46401.1 NAD+ synthase (glutamine-hydrolysing) [Lachnobacterium bovis]
MRNGFVKVAAVTPKVKVADVKYNGELIRDMMNETASNGAKVVVFPELCITGYTCGDLFLQEQLLDSAKDELRKIAMESETLDAIFFVGLPLELNGKLYNVVAAVSRGDILALIPKIYLPTYNEFYEGRYFASGKGIDEKYISISGEEIPFTTDIILQSIEMPKLKIAAEICEDLWTPNPPSISHALSGATLIVNLSASDEVTGKSLYRKQLVAGQSARLICGYIYCSAGDGESTSDVVYSAHNIIAENGSVLKEAKRFANETIYSEIDFEKIEEERRRMTTFEVKNTHKVVKFHVTKEKTVLTRYIAQTPFVPSNIEYRDNRCEEILHIQAMGLKKRLEHTNCKSVVIGISGGLDSTLALIVAAKAFDLVGLPRKNIVAVTMPGFGTTDRTYDNAVNLINKIGATFKEVSIVDAVNIHFRDIEHDSTKHDVTYENSQARERTQILMDMANKYAGLVIGTGDLSELALGWATYNGDHMSMYAVNVSIPKTLVRYLVKYYADTCEDEVLSNVLLDVLDTPVSPELLPPEDGKISQKTEDLVGPYELHDFFMYYILRFGFSPKKVYRLALKAFVDKYDREVILKWLKSFYRRFFAQQFKRSCLPDGPKVGTVAVSPRGDLRMPSDACARIWLDEVDEIEELYK